LRAVLHHQLKAHTLCIVNTLYCVVQRCNQLSSTYHSWRLRFLQLNHGHCYCLFALPAMYHFSASTSCMQSSLCFSSRSLQSRQLPTGSWRPLAQAEDTISVRVLHTAQQALLRHASQNSDSVRPTQLHSVQSTICNSRATTSRTSRTSSCTAACAAAYGIK
jgi:hypothetical protein